jgi:hypothetical protein
VLRRWQAAPVLGFGTKRPTPTCRAWKRRADHAGVCPSPAPVACGDLVPATANTRNEQRTLPACIDPYRSASDHSGPIGADEALWLALCLAPDEGTDVSELLHLTGMSHPTLYRRLAEHAKAGRAVRVSRGCHMVMDWCTRTATRALASGVSRCWIEEAHVTELTGLLRDGPAGDQLYGWPEKMRIFARRERPRPGAQLTLFEAEDGWRYTLWMTNLPRQVRGWRGQLAYIDAAHRVHARGRVRFHLQ